MTREEAKELFKKASDIAGNYFEHVEIVSMHNIDIVLSEIYNDHEAQLKSKENHIVDLNKMVMEKNEIIDVLHISSSGFNDLYDDYRKLSRKIVAMLFWEWRKQERRFNQEWERDKTSITCAEFCVMSAIAEKVFKKAYAMLNDNA